MKSKIVVAVLIAVVSRSVPVPAAAAPTALSITFPLHFGGHRAREPERAPTAAEISTEKRLRLARYGLQLADAIVSVIGYRAYAKCLSCLAYPGGGPVGSVPLSMANISGDRPAEANPVIQPFARGGLVSLALGTLAYDLVDGRVEKRWSIERRASADIAEIGAHIWGISTWLPELKTIHRDSAIASACGAQWRAKQYGQAFSDGCVNEYYRAGPTHASPAPGAPVTVVCAPAKFKPGTFLFATSDDYIVASGSSCSDLHSPFR